jgi:phosphomannomutase
MKNETLYLFDLDGTLTPSRQSMEKSFARRFIPFIKEQSTYIVSGSDIAKVKEQLPAEVFFGVSGILSSMGNEFYIKGKEIFNRGFIENDALLSSLEMERKNAKYPFSLYPNYIEKRFGAINFSVLGRDCPFSERVKYKSWDDEFGERKAIINRLAQKFSDYEFSIGGTISIDIVEKGFGKEQAADILRKQFPKSKIIFFGDKIFTGGNDYSLAQRLLKLKNVEIYEVKNPSECLKLFCRLTQNGTPVAQK